MVDPSIALRNSDGVLVAANDNWRETDAARIIATGIPPEEDAESAIVTVLVPSAYTAVVRGQNGATGVGLVEVYNLP